MLILFKFLLVSELKKRFYETEIQILVSPSFLISSDTVIRPSKEKHLKQGHLLLSALQVHIMIHEQCQWSNC